MVTERTKNVHDTLRDLIEVNRDAEKGFKESAEKMDDASAASTFRQFAEQRGRFANELIEIGNTYELAEEEGSMTGALHRAWIGLKDAFTSGDHAILAAAEVGEDHAVETYEDALGNDLPEDVMSVIRRQFTEVKEAHDRVRALRDATA